MRCTSVHWNESGSLQGARHTTPGQDKWPLHGAWPCKGVLSNLLENYLLFDSAGEQLVRKWKGFSVKYVK